MNRHFPCSRFRWIFSCACLWAGLLVLAPAGAARQREKTGPTIPTTDSAAQPRSVTVARGNHWRIPRVTRPPRFEDYLQGKPREAELEVNDFRQFDPGDGEPATLATRAYLSYDAKHLYVVFVCRDEPGKVRARLAKREDIDSDEQVILYLDTFHDQRRAYVFASNPLGIQLDGIYTEGQTTDYTYDTVWYTEGRLTRDGFAVWISIPFRSIRFSGDTVQNWGIALSRVIPRKNETIYAPYVTHRIEGLVNQMATLEGLENIASGRNLQVIPYGIFTHSRFLDTSPASGPAFNDVSVGRAGLDAKAVFKDALTLDVTLNPDFSQVESDEPQVTINQRFEVFFPEKRPFFLENAGYFQTFNTLLFTRRIADPQFGVRLTGKLGPWSLGVFGIDDRAPCAAVPEPCANLSPSNPLTKSRAGIGVMRVQRDIGKQSFIGALVTSRDFGSSSNRVYSLDTRLKLSTNWVFEGQVVETFTRNLDASKLNGPAYWALLRHTGRHLLYFGRYLDRSANFRADIGFIPRTDLRLTEHFLDYSWRPRHGPILAYGPSAQALLNWNHAGQLTDWITRVGFGVTLPGQTTLEVRRNEAFELFQNLGFRKHFTEFIAATQWFKWLQASADYSQGNGVNYFPGAGFLPAGTLNPFLSHTRNGSLGLSFRPWPKLHFDQTYLYSQLETRTGSTPLGFLPGTAVFNNHILRSKVNYQFTRELSVRAIVDYNGLLSNTQLFAAGRSKKLSADFLVTYLIHPGTAFYVGYTDRYGNVDIDPAVPGGLRTTNVLGTSTSRQFFVKLSYLFRY